MIQIVPNSHSWGSLQGVILTLKEPYRRKDVTDVKEHIIIGLENCLDCECELRKVKEPLSYKLPCFRNIQQIIYYLSSLKYFEKDIFISKLEQIIESGYDIQHLCKLDRREVYDRIDTEREYQELRWEDENKEREVLDYDKSPAEWLNYMEHHMSEAKKANYFLNKEETLAQIRKVVALGVRALEVHGCPERILPINMENQDGNKS
jgi:hypothetical protein